MADEPEATATEDESPSFLGLIWEGIKGIFAFLLGLLFGSRRRTGFFLLLVIGLETIIPMEVVQMESVSRSAIHDEEADAELTTNDRVLGNLMIDIVTELKSGSFEMTGHTAEEFGRAYFQPSENVSLRRITFDQENKSVTVHYDMDVSKEVTLVFRRTHITKTLVAREGFSGGTLRNYWNFFWWHAWRKFHVGYPRYTSETDIQYPYTYNNETSVSVKKEMIHLSIVSRIVWLWEISGQILRAMTG